MPAIIAYIRKSIGLTVHVDSIDAQAAPGVSGVPIGLLLALTYA